MYTGRQDTTHRSFKMVATIAVAIVIVVAAAGLFLMFAQDSSSNPSINESTPTSAGTTIPLVTNTPVLSEEPVTAPADEPQEPEVTPGPNYQLDLPAGWALKTTETALNPCDDSEQEWVTTTYQNGTKTITVYENGLPSECDSPDVTDVFLPFEYTADGSGLSIDTDGTIVFCSLETPGCPKGDGRVSITIANEDPSAPTSYTINPLNRNSYFFDILDTSVEADLDQQVEDLVDIVRTISFTL